MVETASLGSNAGGVGGVGSDVAGSEAGTGGGGGGGGGGIPPGLPFQVGYREAGQEYTLYLLAAREQDRTEWIRAIRAGEFRLFLFFSLLSFLSHSRSSRFIFFYFFLLFIYFSKDGKTQCASHSATDVGNFGGRLIFAELIYLF